MISFENYINLSESSKIDLKDFAKKSFGIPGSPNQKAAMDMLAKMSKEELKTITAPGFKMNLIMKQIAKIRLKEFK